MRTKHWFSFFIAISVLVSLACAFGVPKISRLKTGPVKTLTLNEPHPVAEMVDVTFALAIGEFNLSSGAQSLVEGDVHYNVAEWEPVVTRTANSLVITQGAEEYTQAGFPSGDVINEWNIELGAAPMNLTLQAGAYHSILDDLSGRLRLCRFTVQDGASQAQIRFDTPNSEKMDRLSYQTGASEIEFIGLANANFEQLNFEGGAGEYSFDFSGELRREAEIHIQVGLSTVQIIVPEGIAVQVMIEGRAGQIKAAGTWQKEGSAYVNAGRGPRLTITPDMGAGELRLVNK